MLRHPSTFIQRSLALFLSLGHNDAQLRRLAMAQKERHGILMKALSRFMPECVPVPVSGGGAVWLRLPDYIHPADLAEQAAHSGVLIEPGDVFFVNPIPSENFVRLGYQSIPANAIEKGISTLAEVLFKMTKC